MRTWHHPSVKSLGSFVIGIALALTASPGVAAGASGVEQGASAFVWPPPSEAFDPGNVVCPTPPLDAMRTILGVVLDHGAVERAVGVLGSSPLREEGDAGDYAASRCWEAANGDGTLLCLERGEVHAGLTVLGREVASARRGASPLSALVRRGMATGAGLRLGLPKTEVTRIVGRDSRPRADQFYRACCSKRPMTAAEKAAAQAPAEYAFFDVCTVFRGVFADGKVVGFAITWAETN
jgi:hypothetical protein